jgi:hypothetical protein
LRKSDHDVSAELIGIKAVEEIANTLNTALDAPLKEVGNYIADKIRYLRYGSLLKIVKRAEEKAKKQGMALKMPPLKFFVPYAEAASLEENIEDASSLEDAWANLLLSAGLATDARHLLYLRLLKELTGHELSFLDRMVNSGRGLQDSSWSGAWWHHHDCTIFNEDFIFSFIRNINPQDNTGDIPQTILENLEQPGLLFHHVEILCGTPYVDRENVAYLYDGEEYWKWESAIDVLSALNIIREFRYEDIPFDQHRSYVVGVTGCVLTNLGVDFFDVCSGTGERKTPAKKWDGTAATVN